MKIAFFTNNYLPNPYGVSRSIESFRHQLTALGNNVTIFAPAWDKDRSARDDVYRYPSIDIRYRFNLPLVMPYSRKLSSVLKNSQFNVIHTHHPTALGVVAKKVAQQKNIPLIFTWHTLYDHYTNFVPFPLRFLVFWWFIPTAVRYANNADSIVVPTEYTKQYMLSKGVTNPNISIIPTGITSTVYDKAQPDTVRKEHYIAQENTIILTVCRLTKEKNVLFLTEVVLPVLKRHRNVCWIVVGDGYLRASMEECAVRYGVSDRVLFVGEKNQTEVRDYYAGSDIFVYASVSETQGMVISEAMYMGLPIVAVDSAGVSDLIIHKETGMLVEEKKDVFEKTLELLLQDDTLKKKLSQTAKSYALEHFTDIVCSKRLLKVYRDTIARKKSELRH